MRNRGKCEKFVSILWVTYREVGVWGSEVNGGANGCGYMLANGE